jgi:hypothetical protein
MTVYKWSATAASNASIDDTINAREGQAPSTVNDAMRGIMAAIAKWRADMSGNLVTAGTSTAYTLTTNQVYSALTDGIAVTARMDEVNGAAATLNVDSLGAKSIATVYGTAVGAGKLRAGAVYVFVYDSTDDKWIVQGNPNAGFESGTKLVFRQTAAPVGWTKDTTYTDAALRVTSGTISQQATAGKEFSTLFASRTIATANLPSHTHSFSATTSSDGAHTHTASRIEPGTGAGPGFSSGGNYAPTNTGTNTSSNGAHTHTVSGTTGATGSGTAMDFDVNFVDLIIATRD